MMSSQNRNIRGLGIWKGGNQYYGQTVVLQHGLLLSQALCRRSSREANEKGRFHHKNQARFCGSWQIT